MPETDRPKIGLALSGGSGRAIAHIGVLEVLREHNIPIDYITACSSGAIIAASYACGTTDALKQDWLGLDKKFLFNLFPINTSGKGIFSMDKVIEFASKYIQGKKFEEVRPHLGIVCVDVLTAEPIVLAMGDIEKATAASCAVPALFPPVAWGNRLLVDGGLFSIVPTSQARDMGADIVIGVDIAATRYAFSQKFHRLRWGYNILRKSFPVRAYLALHNLFDRAFSRSMNFIFYNQSDFLEEEGLHEPGLFGILGRAIDIATERKRDENNQILDCDYLISPRVKHLGKIDFQTGHTMLEEGRRAAAEAIPEIERVINNWNWKKNHRSIKHKI